MMEEALWRGRAMPTSEEEAKAPIKKAPTVELTLQSARGVTYASHTKRRPASSVPPSPKRVIAQQIPFSADILKEGLLSSF